MFTKENAKELGAKGIMSRMLFTSPEKRKYIAKRNIARRWYHTNGDDLDRIECLLRLLAREVADAMVSEDHDRVIRGVSAMLGPERIKIALRAGNMRDVTPELSGEIEAKLAKARERRDLELNEPIETTATKPA